MERRFPALRIVATIYKIISVIVALITLLAAGGVALGGTLLSGSPNGGGFSSPLAALSGGISGLFAAGFILIYGGMIAVTVWAFSDGIYLALAIEENTRAAVTPVASPYSP